jgi:uncharacterized protein
LPCRGAVAASTGTIAAILQWVQDVCAEHSIFCKMKGQPLETTAYHTAIETWRQGMEAKLRADNSWLTLAGLFWLKEGQNSFGADPENDIVLPAGSAPGNAGTFELHAGGTTLHVANGASVMVNGRPVLSAQLRSDATGAPDLVAIDDLMMRVIQRGDRYGIRLWDKRSPARAAFPGRRWFPVQESYCVTASFVSYDPPKIMPIVTILGDIENTPSPGYAIFSINGQAGRLDASYEEDGELFFTFRDATAGDLTYPAGRFLKTPLPQDGQPTIDFNKAYNPPCAFTPYATCPLPPPQNDLPQRIEAGEIYQ